MTDAEQTTIMGEAVAELAGHRRKMACLKSKVESMQRELRAAVNVLEGAKSGGIPSGVSPDEARYPSYDDVVRVHGELLATQARISELEARMREWGALN